MISRARCAASRAERTAERFPVNLPCAQIGQLQFISEGFVSLQSGRVPPVLVQLMFLEAHET